MVYPPQTSYNGGMMEKFLSPFVLQKGSKKLLLEMILYNISIIVEDSSHDQVLDWLTAHLRKSSYETKFLKMLESPHEGSTYCVQFVATDDNMILKFQREVLAELQAYLASAHEEKAFIFDSKMQYLALD